MPNVFDPHNIHRLDNPERRRLLPPVTTLKKLGLKKGDVLVDIGAGTGYFAVPAAKITGRSGRVIATDLSGEMLSHLNARAEEAGVTVETLLTPPNSIPLPDETADMTLVALVFHELDERTEYLNEIKRITKPTGTLSIIDWEKVESPMGPPLDHRISLEEATKHVRDAGFRISIIGMLNPYQYFITAHLH